MFKKSPKFENPTVVKMPIHRHFLPNNCQFSELYLVIPHQYQLQLSKEMSCSTNIDLFPFLYMMKHYEFMHFSLQIFEK